MSGGRSFRSRLFVGSLLWTLGVLFVVAVLLAAFLATHQEPHRVVFTWFLAVPPLVIVLMGAVCMVMGALQIRQGLSAIEHLREQLLRVHRGEVLRVEGAYPSEVQPLVDDLNALLNDRETRVAGALAAAGDLAHELKTPLAVLARDATSADEVDGPAMASARAEHIDRMRRVIDYHLAGTRASAAAHLPTVRCELAPAVDGLLRTVARLYVDRRLALDAAVPSHHTVRCRREDVDEMLGNLVDNACKWANARVMVASRLEGAQCVITVDDDGPGVDPALAHAVLERGVRADQRVPGTGLGLAIVRQLADAYGGAIALAPSPHGGLRAQLSLPIAAAPARAAGVSTS